VSSLITQRFETLLKHLKKIYKCNISASLSGFQTFVQSHLSKFPLSNFVSLIQIAVELILRETSTKFAQSVAYLSLKPRVANAMSRYSRSEISAYLVVFFA